MLFDTHCHLDTEAFDEDREQVMERAQAAGVTQLMCVGASDNLKSAARAIALAEKHSWIYASAGVHPHDSALEYQAEELEKLACHPRVFAVGETGLDFFRDWSPVDRQKVWFQLQIDLAKKVKKPLIIHSRSAAEECFEFLNKSNAHEVGGVFHCYSEDAAFAARLKDINFLVSFPGTLTFKKASEVRDAARDIPLEQIMLETDAPYMAPTPFRGKRCEPAFVRNTAEVLAEVKKLSLEEIAAVTTKTAENFFQISSQS